MNKDNSSNQNINPANRNVQPQPNRNAQPQTNRNAQPQPSRNAQPQPNRNMQPQPNRNAQPQPRRNSRPRREAYDYEIDYDEREFETFEDDEDGIYLDEYDNEYGEGYGDDGDYPDDYDDYDGYDDGGYDDDGYDDDGYDDDYDRNSKRSSGRGSKRGTTARRNTSQQKIPEAYLRKQKRRRVVEVWAGFIILVIIVVICYIEISNRMYKGQPLKSDVLAAEIPFDVDRDFKEAIGENHELYMKKAYMIINGEYYKIKAGVERNDIDFENDFAIGENNYLTYYDDGTKKSVTAIDISVYNKSVDFEKVKEAGIDVVMIRLGYRSYDDANPIMVLDKNYKTNVAGSTGAGLKTGVYFFTEAKNYDEGVEEAQFVLENIKGYNITEPIVVDTELITTDDSARANGISTEDRTAAVDGFCKTIKDAGYTPMIYANRNWFIQNLDVSKLADYEFWMAMYAETTNFPYHLEGWQYTSEGSVPGVSGNCDVSVWFRDQDQ